MLGGLGGAMTQTIVSLWPLLLGQPAFLLLQVLEALSSNLYVKYALETWWWTSLGQIERGRDERVPIWFGVSQQQSSQVSSIQ